MIFGYEIPEWCKTLAISALGSVITLLLQRLFRKYDKAKKLKVFVKFVGSKTDHLPCRYENNEILYIPLWIELVNSHDVPLICRDVNLYLYCKGKEVDRFHQLNAVEIKNKEEVLNIADNGRYSFVVQANTVHRFEGEFSTKKCLENEEFDSIYVSYIDGNNRVQKHKLIDIACPWNNKELKYKTNYWYELK